MKPDNLPDQIGSYSIHEELGRGGMAVVYRATDRRSGRVVALKILPPEFARDDRYLRRFLREGRHAQQLRHPNLVRVYDAGSADGYYYLALQYIDGPTLAHYLKARPMLLDPRRIVQIINQIAAGLDHAHDQGFLHRDIKPGNILLTRENTALLTDFGVAKALDEDQTAMTQLGSTVGTPAFMSPEQARGVQLDRRSDIYSLGVVAYMMLTGQPPFKADSQPELLHKIVYESPRPARELNPDIPPGIIYALERAMAKEPPMRYASAGAFAQALAEGLTWSPSQPSWPAVDAVPAQARSARTRRWPALLILLIAVGLIAGALFFLRSRPQTAGLPPDRAAIASDTPPHTATPLPAMNILTLRTYRAPDGLFEVSVPSEWAFSEQNDGRTRLILFDAPDRMARLFVNVMPDASDDGAEIIQNYLVREGLPYGELTPLSTPAADRAIALSGVTQDWQAVWLGRPVVLRLTAVTEPGPMDFLIGAVVEANEAERFGPVYAAMTQSFAAQVPAAGDSASALSSLPAENALSVASAPEANDGEPPSSPPPTRAATATHTPTIGPEAGVASVASSDQGRLPAEASPAPPTPTLPTPDPTATPSSTPTFRPTSTPLPTRTATDTPTATPTYTRTATSSPTLTPRPTSTPLPTHTATNTLGATQGCPRAGRSRVPTHTATNTLGATATTMPTATPKPPTATPLPPAAPTAVSSPTAGPASPPAPVVTLPPAPAGSGEGGMITSFEPFGQWRTGDQKWATFTPTTDFASDGTTGGRIAYDFPAEAGTNDFAVFLAQPPIPLPAGTSDLTLQVYGDGAGNFLNVWIADSAQHLWQFTFGQVNHQGWTAMNASLTPSQEWPNGPVEGDVVAALTPPLSLYAFVLDGIKEGQPNQGELILDALRAGAAAPTAQADASVSTPVASSAATPPPADAASPVADAPLPAAVTGRIAVAVFNGAAMDTYIMNAADGSILKYLPNLRQPDINGGLLTANGQGGGADNIYRMGVDGSNSRAISFHPEDNWPQWSASADSIVYSSTQHGDGRWRLYWQQDAGAQAETPPMSYSGRELFGQYPVYLDNWRIAYQGCNSWAGGSSCGIYTTDTSGSEPLQATTRTDDLPTGNLGNQILFMSRRDGDWNIYAVNWDGSGLRQLTNDPAIDALATGSPDYSQVAFVSNRSGNWAVYVMSAAGGDARRLFDLPGGYGGGEFDVIQERISWGP